MSSSNNYRWTAKKGFGTYPQCPMSPEAALAALQAKAGFEYGWNIVSYIVATEDHVKEGKHLHLYIEGDTRWNIKKPDFLDIQDEDGKTYHGHWLTCRSPARVKAYCTKKGDFITNMTFSLMADVVSLAKEGKAQEAFDLIAEREPRLVITQASRLKDSIGILGGDKPREWKAKYSEFENEPGLMKEWHSEIHCLLLCGASGFGKTTYAMWLMRPSPLKIDCKEDLKQLRDWHTGLVFDDFKPYKWTREDAIHLTDMAYDQSIDVKFGKIVIPKGLKRVFVANANPFPPDKHGAIRRRVLAITVRKPLFDKAKAPAEDVHADDDWDEQMGEMYDCFVMPE